MKLRYYMRGLGIGIIVTALIMGIAAEDTRPLTDAEIRAAAQQLGMVESDSLKLSDIQQPSASVEDEGEPGSAEPEDAAPEESGDAPESSSEEELPESAPEENEDTPEGGNDETAQGDSSEENEGISESGTQDAEENSPKEEDASESVTAGERETMPEGGTVTITVEAGSGSRTVCNQLAEAGLIEDAAAFDRYLIQNGYSKRICVGTYEIEPGTDMEQIAKIITKTK